MSTAAETPEIRRKRLRFRSWHRGMQEMDLLLGRFADAHLPSMDAAALDRFEAVLRCGDQDLYGWITGTQPWPPELDNELTRQLTEFTQRGPEK